MLTNHPEITLDSHIQFRPLSKQVEAGAVILGWADHFLELPQEGLDFLGWLDEGMSLAEARARFETRHNPFPTEDVLAVMAAFQASDFIATIDGQSLPPRFAPRQAGRSWIPQGWAQVIFSTPVLLTWLALAVPAALIWVVTPELWPRRADYFWTDYYFIVVLVGTLLWLFNMVLHEAAHYLACRAKGIEATITWTQRLGLMPMSQTIMHNIWAVPRSTRLFPIAAGMVVDFLRMSVVIYLLYFAQIGLITLPELLIAFLKFYLLTATLALVAQFWLFSKMDGYFLLSALLGQRNLQADTFNWLTSKLSSKRNFVAPTGGMKFIYIYVVITLVWGGLFMGQVLFVSLPIKIQLLWESLLKTMGGVSLNSLEFADGVAVFTSQMIFWGLLLYAYWRDTLPNWRRAQ
jgi:hypothetical protein